MQKATLLAGLHHAPGDPVFLEALGSILETDEAWDEILEIFNNQLSSLPVDSPIEAYVKYMMGKARVELGQIAEAQIMLERSAQIKPDFPYTHHLLARCYLDSGRLQESLSAFQHCTILAPGFPWSWLGQGEVEILMGQPIQAMNSLKQGLSYQQKQGGHTQPFIDAILKAKTMLSTQHKRNLAAELWPSRTPLADDQRLDPRDEMELSLYRLKWIVDRIETDQDNNLGSDLIK